jgi:glycosyltransferase involved in cell wall biosynthesis
MKVFLSAVQAGNRSGTGRYTEELARALAARADISLTLESSAVAPGPGVLPARPWSRVLGPGGAFDVMHYPANFCPVAGASNTVVTVHDLSFLRHPEWFSASRARYYRWAFAITRRRAARFIADSHATRRDLVEIAGVREDLVDVAHLGVAPRFRPAPPDAQAEARARYILPPRFLLYIGTLEPRKNLPRLLAAFDKVAPSIAQDLVIGGREGWKVAGIREALAGMRHASRVHFPGFIEEMALPAVLSAADGFVWPSLFEGFGLPPLEALACGTPVLTSRSSSLPELFEGHAILVDPGSTGEIAEGLCSLAEVPIPADAQHAQSFTWERTAEAVVTAYGRLKR